MGTDPQSRDDRQECGPERGARLGPGPRRARRRGFLSHPHDRCLQSQQPDRRHSQRRRNGCYRARRLSQRRLDPRGRDLPGIRTKRKDDALLLGKVRSRDRHQRAVQGLRAARPEDRLDCGSQGPDREDVVLPRLHDNRSGNSERRAGSRRSLAGRTQSLSGAHARHLPKQLPALPGMDGVSPVELPHGGAARRGHRLRAL